MNADADVMGLFKASTVQQRKAFIFAAGWLYREKYGLKKYPDAYAAARKNIGVKSLIFGVPRWPKKFERGPQQAELNNFYQLMERSLENNERAVERVVRSLIGYEGGTYHHDYVSYKDVIAVFIDTMTTMPSVSMPYTEDSKRMAFEAFDKEKFGVEIMVLADSLEESGHCFESDHLRTGKHTPACPVLRKIAGIK
jgi:hypothetical protein